MLEYILGFELNLWGIDMTNYVIGCSIFVIFLLLRTLFAKVIMKILNRLADKTKNEYDNKIIEALESPLKLAFVVIGLWILCTYVIEDEAVLNVLSQMVRSMYIGISFWALYRTTDVISNVLSVISKKAKIKYQDVLIPLANKVIKVITVAFAILMIAQEWNYQVTGIVAGLGLGGLAFALAAQDTLSNLFGSVTLMLDRPFAIGDWIYTDHVEGTVEEIGFRSTKVRTFAQALVSIPNSVLSKEAITNWSRMGKRRIYFHLGVEYATSHQKMKTCVESIRELLTNHKDVHKETIMVYFETFNDSSLDIMVYFFSKTTNWAEYLKVKEDINLKIMELLESIQVSVAFPSRSLYIENDIKLKKQ